VIDPKIRVFQHNPQTAVIPPTPDAGVESTSGSHDWTTNEVSRLTFAWRAKPPTPLASA
jgi:hypothetical protein